MCSQDCDLFSTNAAAKVGKSARGSWLANNGTVSKNFTSAHLGTALDPTCSSALHNIPMSSMSHQEINHKTPKNHWWCIVIEKHVLTGDVDFAAFHPLTSWLVISSSTHLLVYTIHGEHVTLNGVFWVNPWEFRAFCAAQEVRIELRMSNARPHGFRTPRADLSSSWLD